MASFLESLGAAVRETACGILSVQDTTINFVNRLTPTGLGPYPDIVRSLRRTVCNNNNGTVSSPSPPFQNAPTPPPACGTASGYWFYYSDFVNPGFNAWYFQPETFVSPPVAIGNFRNNGTSVGRVDITNSNGVVQTSTPVTAGRSDGQFSASDFRVCYGTAGTPQPPTNSPPPSLGPYNPTPVNKPITYDGPGGSPVTENVNITIFAPVLIAPVTIVAPVTIAGNNFTLKGEVQFSPTFQLNVSPQFNIGSDGFGDNDPPTGQNPPPDSGKNSYDRKIIGALVTVTDAVGGRASIIAQANNPNIYAPGLGFVSFLVSTDRGRGWTVDIPVKNTKQYVPCPAPQGAIDVAGTASSGYAFTVTPIYNRPAST